MNYSDEIIIKQNSTKLIITVIGAVAAVAAGVWLLQSSSTTNQGPGGHRGIVYFFVFLSVLFGIYGVFSAKKLVSRKPGVILNSAGIDNSSGIAATGFVPWSDIEGFAAYKAQKQIFLIVKLFHPEKYVNSGSLLKRLVFKMNVRACGSPIIITANSLQIDFNELASLCAQYLQKYGKPDKSS